MAARPSTTETASLASGSRTRFSPGALPRSSLVAWCTVALACRLIALPAFGQTGAAKLPEPGRVPELRELIERGRYDEAWELGGSVREELERGERPSLELARTLHYLSNPVFDQRRNRSESGVELGARSVALHLELLGQDHPWTLDARTSYGATLAQHGRFTEAQAALRATLESARSAPDQPSGAIGTLAHVLASVLQEMGRYEEARTLYEEALGAYGHEQRVERGKTLVALAVLLSRTGDQEEARRALEEAEALWSQTLGRDHPNLGFVHHNLGNVLSLLGEREGARDRLERALAVWRPGLGDAHPLVGAVWSDLAALERASGRFERSRECYEKALEVHGALGRSTAWAQSAAGLADLLRGDGDLGKARELYQGALDAYAAQVVESHPEIVSVSVRLAHLELDAGNRSQALTLARGAARLVHRHLRDTIAGLSERQALLALGGSNRVGAETVLVRGLRSAVDDRQVWLEGLWEWTLSLRALALEELAERAFSLRSGADPALRAAWEGLAAARTELANAWNRGPRGDVATFEAELSARRRRKEEAERRFALLRERGGVLSENVSLDALRRHLPEGSAVVEIVRASPGWTHGGFEATRDLALILEGAGALDFVDLGPSEALDETVRTWRRALSAEAGPAAAGELGPDAASRIEGAGEALRALVWDPVKERLRGEPERVFLVPEGALHEIDLDALPMGQGRTLAEEGPILHQLGAARDLLRYAEEAVPVGRGVLALGGPDYDEDPEVLQARADATVSASFRGEAPDCRPSSGLWLPLPESVREVLSVASLLEPEADVLLLTGNRASETMFKLHAPGKRVLHLATHGFFFSQACAGSEAPAGRSPLLLSGLVLAGANRPVPAAGRMEDGILTAEEVAALQLDGVELAVLSACDTGLGVHATAEGPLGLERAFTVAGVRTVVMSVWKVPDRRSRQLVTELYRQRAEGQPLPVALRRAKLSLLERLRAEGSPLHPYLWAGFVSSGDWR